MKRLVFGDALRDMTRLDPVHPDLGPSQSGSQLLERYTELHAADPAAARVFGKSALLQTVWNPDYQLLASTLDDQTAIDDFSDDQTKQLLAQKHDTILGYEATLQTQLPAIYDTYQTNLQSFVQQGVMPAAALDRFGRVAEDTEWIVTDDMNGVLGRASAVHRHAAINSDVFTAHHSWQSTESCVQQIVSHELTHRLAGTWSAVHDGNYAVYRTGLQLPYLSWLNEAVTELIADSVVSGRWNQAHPANPNYTYPTERTNLQRLLTAMPLEPLINYYFAEDDDGASKKELHRAFREQVGMTVHDYAKATRPPEPWIDQLSQQA